MTLSSNAATLSYRVRPLLTFFVRLVLAGTVLAALLRRFRLAALRAGRIFDTPPLEGYTFVNFRLRRSTCDRSRTWLDSVSKRKRSPRSSPRALKLIQINEKASSDGLAPFFRRECTERASRVKPLRFAPTAARALLTRGLDSSSSTLLSCLH